MGFITVRKRKDGSVAYNAQVRIMQKGVTVYQESQTFDRKASALAQIKRVETEMAAPGAITKANRSGVTVKEMIDRYLLEYEKLRPLGKTKRATLKAIGETWLGKLEDKEITSQKLVEYANGRMKDDGIQAQTVGLDLKDWPHYRDLLKLPDFGPISQDKLAIQHIRECRALPDVNAGRIEQAIDKCRNIWASLLGAGYGQREHRLQDLISQYERALQVLT